MEMNFDEICASLASALAEKQEELDYFSEKLDRHLFDNADPTSKDLFELGTFLENGGGSYDEIGYSLVRLAALDGYVEAIEWYESNVGVRIVPENPA